MNTRILNKTISLLITSFIVRAVIRTSQILSFPYKGHLAVALLLLFLTAIAINIFLGNWLYQRHVNIKIKAQREILGQIKDEAEKNIKAMVRKMKVLLFANWAIYIFFIIFCLAILFFSLGFFNDWIPLPLSIILFIVSLVSSFFMLWGLIDMIINKAEKTLPEYELHERDYPELFKIIKEAANIVGAGKHVRLFLGSGSVGVFRHKQFDCILIGDIPMNCLTKEEMKQILIHEFAHVYNENTTLMNKLTTASNIWQTQMEKPLLSLSRVLMKVPVFFFNREIFFYTACATRVQEIEADNIVKRLGDKQVYINALAKHAALGIFVEMPCPERDIHIYEKEEPVDNYGDIYLDLYYKYLEKKETLWRQILDNELTPFLDSHPTFKARKEAMEVNEYTFYTKETDEGYIKEQRKLLDYRNKLSKEGISESYKEIREHYYVKRFQAIEKYEKNPNQSIQELIDTALYYEGIDNDKAKEIFNLILKKDQDNAYALYHLGRMFLNEFNKEGISYIYKAIEMNDNFAGDGLNLIGHFCIKAGLQEELEEYRRNVVDMGQKAIDKTRAIVELDKKDNLLPHDLDDDTLQEILNFMTTTANGKLDKILLTKKVVDDLYSYIFLIKGSKDVSEQEFSQLYYDIFTYLDLREEQFTLLNVYDENKLKWLYKKVKGCVVWSKPLESTPSQTDQVQPLES